MENKLSEIIKDIAIYLRKSRAKEQEETDETLHKHNEILVDFAKKNDLRYVIYKEIASGDSINGRPEMIRLLNDIENDLFDAVLVVDYDRLSRASEEDSGKIKRIFKKSGTLIITPNKVYNLDNEDDETFLELISFMSRQEYKMIKRRMMRGKKIGSKMGNWTNGIPPLGYLYDKNSKSLIIDEERLPIYNLIKSMFLDKLMTVENIAIELNKLGIPTSYSHGTKWHGNVVMRILTSETHLGKIISNKTKGNSKKGEKVIYNSKDKFIIVENCHNPVKTQEEHNRILELFNQRKLIASRAKQGVFDFSGIIKCSICGYSHTFLTNKKTGKVYMKPCWYVDAFGNKCKNRSGNVDEITEKVKIAIINKRDRLIEEIKDDSSKDNTKTELMIKQKLKQIDKFKSALSKIDDTYDLGDYTREQWLERKSKWENEINKVNIEIIELERNKLKNNEIKFKEDMIKILDYMINNLQIKINPEERNNLYKMGIEKIIWNRIGDNEGIIKISWK